jgi:DNA-binding FadR family transcriptional regulator
MEGMRTTGNSRQGKRNSTAASIAADRLAEQIISLPPGTFLGFEEALLQELGVSRVTFRQTARILQHRGLLAIKRGAQGGYYSRLPDFGQVVEDAVLYLRTQNTTLLETTEAAHALTELLSRDAAKSANEQLRRELQATVKRLRTSVPEDMSASEFIRESVELTDAVYGMAEKPALYFVMKIFYRFDIEKYRGRVFERRPDRRRDYRDVQLKMADSVLARQPAEAARQIKLLNQMAEKWAGEDEGSSPKAPNRAL